MISLSNSILIIKEGREVDVSDDENKTILRHVLDALVGSRKKGFFFQIFFSFFEKYFCLFFRLAANCR